MHWEAIARQSVASASNGDVIVVVLDVIERCGNHGRLIDCESTLFTATVGTDAIGYALVQAVERRWAGTQLAELVAGQNRPYGARRIQWRARRWRRERDLHSFA